MPGAARKRRRGNTSTPEPSKRSKDSCDGPPERVVLDRNGDIILHVPSFEHDGQTKNQFLASTKALSLGSPVFNAMLNGRFIEATEPAVGLRAASLLDDDPQALLLLFNIVHLRFSSLPKQISLEELFMIALTSDKYDMIPKVKPFVKHHCNYHRKDMIEPGNEVFFYIAWALGLVRDFKKMFMRLVFEIKFPASVSSNSSRTANNIESADMDEIDFHDSGAHIYELAADARQEQLNKLPIFNSQDEDFSADLPPNAKAAILLIRNDTLAQIRSLCSIYWHSLQSRMMAYATPSHGQYECYAMEFGHLSHILSKWNLHPHSPHASQDASLRSIVEFLCDYKPLRCVGCKMPREKCRSEADYKNFHAGLMELEAFKTNDRPEVVSLLKLVEEREDS